MEGLAECSRKASSATNVLCCNCNYRLLVVRRLRAGRGDAARDAIEIALPLRRDAAPARVVLLNHADGLELLKHAVGKRRRPSVSEKKRVNTK